MDAKGLLYIHLLCLHPNSNSSRPEPARKRPLKNAASDVPAHSVHINPALGALFHYVENNLLMLSLASPSLSQLVFFCFFPPLRSHWQLYLLMRSDFIKEDPSSQPYAGLLTRTLQLDGRRMAADWSSWVQKCKRDGGKILVKLGVL